MLLRGLTHPGVHAFAREYLGDDDHPVPFVGRADDLAALHAFVVSGEPFALVTAPAGRGKSALVLRLARDLAASGHAVAWVPISLRFGTHRSATVDELLTARLRILRGESGHWLDLLTADDERPLLVVLDGLDELHDTALLDALTGLELPDGVQVVAAARTLLDRDAAGWAARLGWTGCRPLALDPLGLAEVAAALPPHHAASAAGLMQRTGGDPLLLRLCMEALDRCEPLPDAADPAELVGAWWGEQRARLAAPDDARATRALAALGAACGVVPWSVLGDVAGDGEEATRAALAGFARFVIAVPGQGVTFAHPRFAEVARWSLATEVQAAQQRYGALVVAARSSDDVSPYWLSFGGAHLEAAGAPDEAFAALLTPTSVRAWRRHEGDMRGLIDEADTLRERALRTLTRAWGGPGALEAVAHLGLALEARKLLQGLDRRISPELRAALVAHGLRSVESTLQAVFASYDGDEPDHRARALRLLLPLVTERAVPVLLATDSVEEWPRAEVIARLHELGLTSLALGLLLDAPQGMGESLAHLAPSLTPDDLTRALEAILATPLMPGSDPCLRDMIDRVALLPLLSPGARETALAEVRAGLESAPPDRCTDYFSEESVLVARLVGRLVQERLAAGDEPGALGWLPILESYLLPMTRNGCSSGTFWVELTSVGAASPAVASAIEAMIERMVARLDWLSLRDWAPLLRWRPRADWGERAAQVADRSGWLLCLSCDMPDDWRPRVEAAILADLRAQITRGMVHDARGLDSGTLTDREALLALLPAWRASFHEENEPATLAWVLAQQGGREGDPRCRALLDELAEQGEPVWEIPGWEQIWTEPERRELLVRWLHAPPAWTSHRDLDQLGLLARELTGPGEEPALARLQASLRALYRREPRLITELVRLSPPDEHADLVATVLARPGASEVAVSLVEALSDPVLRERVARHFLSHPLDWPPHRWPTAVLAALPPGERRDAEQAFVEQLRARGQRVPFDRGTPEWLWEPRLRQWADTGRSWIDLKNAAYDDPFRDVSSWPGQTARLHAELIEALPDAPDESHLRHPEHPTWEALSSERLHVPSDVLLRAVAVMDRMASGLRDCILDCVRRQLTGPERGADGPDDLHARVAFEQALEAGARRPDASHWTRLQVSLWRDADRPVDEQFRRALVAAGYDREVQDVALHDLWSACDQQGRPGLRLACARHLLAHLPPESALATTIGYLYEAEPDEARRSFGSEIQQAALADSHGQLLELLAPDLDDATLLAVLPRVFEPGRGSLVRPVRRIGGPAAVEAWVRGMTAAHPLVMGTVTRT